MDMLRFKELVPKRREALANGSPAPLPKEYRVNQQAARLHPGFMEAELTEIRPLTDTIKAFVFRRVDQIDIRLRAFAQLNAEIDLRIGIGADGGRRADKAVRVVNVA